MKNKNESNQPGARIYLASFLSLALILTTFLLIPVNSYANTEATNRRHAIAWCDNYKKANPGQRCMITANVTKCPQHLHKAKKFGHGLRARKSCISGTVATKHTADYVLQCHGGGRMFARIPSNGNIEIHGFTNAPVSAGTHVPAAGQCAFLDRPLSSQEPHQLLFKIKHAPITHVDLSVREATPAWSNSPIVPVLKAIRTGQLFYVHVRNDRGWLDIRRVGP